MLNNDNNTYVSRVGSVPVFTSLTVDRRLRRRYWARETKEGPRTRGRRRAISDTSRWQAFGPRVGAPGKDRCPSPPRVLHRHRTSPEEGRHFVPGLREPLGVQSPPRSRPRRRPVRPRRPTSRARRPRRPGRQPVRSPPRPTRRRRAHLGAPGERVAEAVPAAGRVEGGRGAPGLVAAVGAVPPGAGAGRADRLVDRPSRRAVGATSTTPVPGTRGREAPDVPRPSVTAAQHPDPGPGVGGDGAAVLGRAAPDGPERPRAAPETRRAERRAPRPVPTPV